MTSSYVDIFKLLLSRGKTHAEALAEFDRDAINKALREGLDGNDISGGITLLDLMSVADREEANRRDLENQAIPLWLAGWTSETPMPKRQTEVMSWFWRAPSKRPGKPGRKYLSTSQAFNAMKKQLTPQPAAPNGEERR